MTTLVRQVGGLVDTALRLYAGSPAEPSLRAAAERLAAPLRVAIAGRVKAGKSTLLNALVGQELAATDAGECTRIVTWYVDGIAYRIVLHPRSGPPRQLPFRQSGGALDIDLGGQPVEEIDRLVVDWPSPTLRTMTLIDTPGTGSITVDAGRRTEAVLAPGPGGVPAVDAVVYLMRHVHGDDVRFLETFRDGSVDRRPVNTIGVLARADEVGHARPDALDTADRIAARYRTDPRVRALCQTVVPVAGLLAASAAGLREREYRSVALLASAPDADWLLASADRFTTGESQVDLRPETRTALIDRLGMFGLRLAVGLVREERVATASDLSRELLEISGLPRLRELLATQFTARADVLKSRSALTALESVLRRHPLAAASRLAHDVERVRAGAHEFAEIALIDRLRDGVVMFTAQETAEAERLLGGAGMDPATRLGVPPGAGPSELSRAAAEQHLRWQRRAEHPTSSRDVAEAARVLVRTCEGILGRTALPQTS